MYQKWKKELMSGKKFQALKRKKEKSDWLSFLPES